MGCWPAGITEGRVLLDVAPLVENGNAVPIRVQVDSPMTAADHVVEIVVFNERNPQRDVAALQPVGPASGLRARCRRASAWPPRSSWWRWPACATAASGRTMSTCW